MSDDDYECWQSWEIEWSKDEDLLTDRILDIIAGFFFETFDYCYENEYEEAGGNWEEDPLEDILSWIKTRGIDTICQDHGYHYNEWDYAPARLHCSTPGYSRVVKRKT